MLAAPAMAEVSSDRSSTLISPLPMEVLRLVDMPCAPRAQPTAPVGQAPQP
ncbi:hypothetical protein SSP35_41_00070 [Streptomyces sp. NBRC 110611]|uniref:hypothetical protein n=1 Tax=Streptomyces sp. NBRC 110611 TaxID=1621259 RepID=UPI0008588E69|nr:hypothetical protein [Streptomyces sp. NBRC 110611]GAU71463.1 hypothetical protein SSP35_41_00070 [Streptomyces sp. NBRC 110611]